MFELLNKILKIIEQNPYLKDEIQSNLSHSEQELLNFILED